MMICYLTSCSINDTFVIDWMFLHKMIIEVRSVKRQETMWTFHPRSRVSHPLASFQQCKFKLGYLLHRQLVNLLRSELLWATTSGRHLNVQAGDVRILVWESKVMLEVLLLLSMTADGTIADSSVMVVDFSHAKRTLGSLSLVTIRKLFLTLP